MNPARAVALLNARTARPMRSARGIAITPEDVALALAWVASPSARLLGRVKYAGQERFAGALVAGVVARLEAVAEREGWGRDQIDSFELLHVAKLAVQEFCEPRVCRRCGGRGFRLGVYDAETGRWRFGGFTQQTLPGSHYERVNCPACEGLGAFPWLEAQRARLARLGRWRWRSVWAGRYREAVLPILDDAEGIFWQRVRALLRD